MHYAGLDVSLKETAICIVDGVGKIVRETKAALSAVTIKTDRRDARGIAQLLRMGWYRPVHCKTTLPSQEVRAILTARAALIDEVSQFHNAPLLVGADTSQ